MSDPRDARTVVVPCAGACAGIVLGTPIPAQPDPSKIVGVCTMGAPPAPGYPPIPPAGFYWAKCSDDTPDEWTVVGVFEEPEGGRWVENTVGGGGVGYVHEWGPKLESHAPIPRLPADAHPLLHSLARGVEDLDREIARLAARRAATLAELQSKAAEWQARPAGLPPMHAETCLYAGSGKWTCVNGCKMTPEDIAREETAKRTARRGAR